MARRGSKAEGALVLALLAIGIPVYVATKIVESIGWIVTIIFVVGGIVIFFWYRHKRAKDRLLYLQNKYKNEDVVRKILRGYFWQGHTQEQLIDSIAHPVAIDNKVIRSSIREVWKYNQTGKNRYSLRITLEGGLVTGWDNKT